MLAPLTTRARAVCARPRPVQTVTAYIRRRAVQVSIAVLANDACASVPVLVLCAHAHTSVKLVCRSRPTRRPREIFSAPRRNAHARGGRLRESQDLSSSIGVADE